MAACGSSPSNAHAHYPHPWLTHIMWPQRIFRSVRSETLQLVEHLQPWSIRSFSSFSQLSCSRWKLCRCSAPGTSWRQQHSSKVFQTSGLTAVSENWACYEYSYHARETLRHGFRYCTYMPQNVLPMQYWTCDCWWQVVCILWLPRLAADRGLKLNIAVRFELAVE